jgi:hypothetical protein
MSTSLEELSMPGIARVSEDHSNINQVAIKMSHCEDLNKTLGCSLPFKIVDGCSDYFASLLVGADGIRLLKDRKIPSGGI